MENEAQARLHRAVSNGDITATEAAIADGATVNIRVDEELPVCAAFASGNMQLVVQLLQHGADLGLPPPTNDGEPIVADVSTSSWSLMPNAFTKWMRQPQRLARPPKYPGQEICKAFLECEFPKEAVLLALLDQGLFSREYVERSNKNEDDILVKLWAFAVETGSSQAVKQFLDLGVPADVQTQKLYPINAMSLAAHKGHAGIVQLLLEHGAKLGAPTAQGPLSSAGLTPLMHCLQFACSRASSQESYLDTLKLLLDAGEDPNAVDKPEQDCRTALMSAIRSSNHGVASVKCLLNKGADPNARDKQGRTPMHYAVQEKDATELLFLLERTGADVNLADSNGNTPLIDSVHRIRRGISSSVFEELLVNYKADVFVNNANGVSALQVVAEFCDIKLLSLVLSYLGSIKYASKADASILIAACRRIKDRQQAVVWLLNYGSGVNGIDPGMPWDRAPGRTPLHEACAIAAHDPVDQLGTIIDLIQAGADVNAKYADPKRTGQAVTPVGLVARHAPSEIKDHAIRLLLEAGADPNGADDFGVPAIASLCSLRERIHPAMLDTASSMPTNIARKMQAVLSMHETDLTEEDEPLTSHENAIRLLLDHGCDITTIDSERKNCLHHAAASNYAAAISIIASHDKVCGSHDLGVASEWSDDLGGRPLHLACKDGNWTTESESKRSGVRTSSSVPWAPLPSLKKQCTRSSKTLRELHKLDVDLYAVDNDGATALHTAARVGNPRIAAWLLLATGPSLVYGHKDKMGRLASHYAVDSVAVTRLLLAFDQTGNVEHEQYFGVERPDPKLCAYVKLQEQTYKEESLQFRAGSNSDGPQEIRVPWWRQGALKVDQLENSALHYAARIGNADVVRAYLEHPEIDIHAQNEAGETALDFAQGNRACEAAILEKYPDLATARHGDWNIPKDNEKVEKTKSRFEAEHFIERLKDGESSRVYDRAHEDDEQDEDEDAEHKQSD